MEERKTTNHQKFICYSCNTNFGEADMLQKHVEHLHSNQKLDFDLSCLNCGYTANNGRQFNDHLELCYTSEPEFSCDVCEFAAKNKEV